MSDEARRKDEIVKSRLNFVQIYSTMILEQMKDSNLRTALPPEQYQNLVSLAQTFNIRVREASASLDSELNNEGQARHAQNQEDPAYVDHALVYIHDGKGPTHPILSAQRG